MATRDLVKAFKTNIGPQGTIGQDWWGTVTAINTGPPKTVTVTVNGTRSSTVCRYLSSYTPTVGDVVVGRRDTEGDYWCHGDLA
jgi:exosome complex RNA-binding protein Rrp4